MDDDMNDDDDEDSEDGDVGARSSPAIPHRHSPAKHVRKKILNFR